MLDLVYHWPMTVSRVVPASAKSPPKKNVTESNIQHTRTCTHVGVAACAILGSIIEQGGGLFPNVWSRSLLGWKIGMLQQQVFESCLKLRPV